MASPRMKLRHNIRSINTLLQDHVHKKLVNHKQFITLKVINYVCKLVK